MWKMHSKRTEALAGFNTAGVFPVPSVQLHPSAAAPPAARSRPTIHQRSISLVNVGTFPKPVKTQWAKGDDNVCESQWPQ